MYIYIYYIYYIYIYIFTQSPLAHTPACPRRGDVPSGGRGCISGGKIVWPASGAPVCFAGVTEASFRLIVANMETIKRTLVNGTKDQNRYRPSSLICLATTMFPASLWLSSGFLLLNLWFAFLPSDFQFGVPLVLILGVPFISHCLHIPFAPTTSALQGRR